MICLSLHRRLQTTLCLLACFFAPFSGLQATEETDHEYPLGPIGGKFRMHTGKAYVRVTSVTAGAPGSAAGLMVSDFLTGVNGVPFSTSGNDFQGVVRELGAAIEYAESTNGALPLNVLRAGVGSVTVNVQLPVLGSQSPATPLNSPKWDAAYERACLDINNAFVASSNGDLSYAGGWAALALLTHPNWNDTTGAKPFRLGVNKYRDYIVGRLNAAQYAPVEDTLYDKSANPNANGASALYLENWFLGQGVMFLSEYVAKTQDSAYLALLQTYAEKMANRIQWWRQPNGTTSGWHQPLEVGMVGHGNVAGDYMHYNFGGGINVVGIHVVGGLAMAKKAGVNMSVAPIDGRYFGYDPATPAANLPAGMTPRENGTGAALSVVPAGFETRQPTLDEKLQFGWTFFKRSQSTSTGHVNYSVGTGAHYDSGGRTPGALFTGLNLGTAPTAEDTQRMDLMKGYLVNDHDIRLNAHAFTAASPCFTSLVLPALGVRERSYIQDNWRFYYTLMREPNGTVSHMAGRNMRDYGSLPLNAAAFTAMQYGVAKGGLTLVDGYPTANQRLVDFSKVSALAWNKLSARTLRTGANGSITLDLGVTDGAGIPTTDYAAAWSTVSGSATFGSPASVDTSIQAAYPGVHTVRLTVTSGSITTTEDIEIQMPQAPIPGYVMGEANYKIYTGISGTNVASLTSATSFPASPNIESTLTQLEGLHSAENYGATITCVVIPPVTGSYKFYIASDDASELWFNPSGSSAAGASKIAFLTGWTTLRNWTSNASQASSTFTLTAGQPYYLQALHKEAGGSKHVSIGWTTPSSSTIQVIDSTSIARPYTPETPAILTQPVGVSTTLGSTINLAFTVSGPEPRFFQWKNEGVNFGSPTSSPTLAITNAAIGHAGTWQCVYTNGDTVLTTNSVTVNFSDAGIPGTGGLWQEFYAAVSGGTIASLTSHATYLNFPDSSGPITQTSNASLGDDYGQRWSGWLVPSVSGNYRFYAAADDATQLYLSYDQYESHKRLIHSITSYTGEKQWSTRTPSAWIPLAAGQRYFVEFLHIEDGGGDHAAFTWQREGDAVPTDGASLIPPANLEYISGGTRPDAATAPPLALPDSMIVAQGSSATLDVTTNDLDGNHAGLIVQSITQPANGSVTQNGRNLTYTPNTGYSGSDSFTYTLRSGLDLTSTTTVSVSISSPWTDMTAWWNLNENTGTIATDATGNGHTATLTSGTTWAPGKLGSGITVASSTQMAVTATGKSVPGSFTITAWMNPTNTSGTDTIFSFGSTAALRTQGSALRFTTFGVLDHDTAGSMFSGGVWTHIALTYTPSTTGGAKFYVNGVLRQSINSSAINTTATGVWRIGAAHITGEWFAGSLDDVRLYNRILSDQDIASIAATTSPFDQWRMAHHTPSQLGNATLSGPLADPEKDGIEHLMEYALGLAPHSSDVYSTKLTHDLITVATDKHLRLTVTKNPAATDVTYAIQVSSDLLNWNTTETTIETNNASTLIARDTVAVKSAQKRFIRLKVSK